EQLVILMAGQSNMLGAGKDAEIPEWQNSIPDNITYYSFGMPRYADALKDFFGPELRLSHVLAEQHPDKKFIIIKYAVAGSSLFDWSTDYSKETAEITGSSNLGSLYSKFLFTARLLTLSKKTRIAALLWMQGERDARFPEAADAYYRNFKQFIQDVRSDLTRPLLPVIFGKINPPPSAYPEVATVQSAQEQIAHELFNVHMIDTEDLSKLQDNLHYDTLGQLELGQRFADRLADYIPDE
ncbi:sialate O-acetylesterase, partial [Thermodesulfobacteriota bacterium]